MIEVNDLIPTLHALQRAKERYGFELTRQLNRLLIRQILYDSRARKMGTQDRVEVWYIQTPAGPANILFDPVRKAIVTFLPKGINNVKGIKVPIIPTSRPRPPREVPQAALESA